MATQLEEVVMATDLLKLQQVLPEVGQGDFDFPFGSHVSTADYRVEIRCRQGLAVQLAVGGQRQTLQMHEGAGDHVFGQVLEQCLAQLFGRCRFPTEVGHQALAVRLAFVLAGDHHHFANAGAQGQGGLDFADFDPQATNLHLEVIAAQVFQGAIGQPAAEVTGLVQARLRVVGKGVCDKPFGTQFRQIQVTPGYADTADMQLTGNAQRLHLAQGIEYVHLNIGDGATDRHAFTRIAGTALPGGDVDGRFGWAIEVMQLDTRQLLFEAPLQAAGQGFAAAQHTTQIGEVTGAAMLQKHIKHRRYEVQQGDTCIAHHLGQVIRFLVTARTGHDQFGAGQQRQEELPDRYVETERGLLQHPIAGLDGIFVTCPEQAVDHAQVFVHHAFRRAGGTGGIEHVGQVGWQQPQRPGVRVVDGLHGQLRAVVGSVEEQ